jgi:hypothetical protein
MSDVFDDLIDRRSPSNDPTRIAAVIASDRRFAYFATAAFAVRLLRLDRKNRQRGAHEPQARGEHPRHRRDGVSGVLRSAVAIWRPDADAVR